MRGYVEKTFHGSHVDLNYAEFEGGGPSLVLSHGFSGRWQGLIAYAEKLTDFHVYAVDHAGHGKSGDRRGSYRFIDFATDMAEFIENVAGPGAAFIGASLGGMIGMIVAGKFPGMISTMVLGDIPIARFRDNYMGSPAQKMRAETYRQEPEEFTLDEWKERIAAADANLSPEQVEARAISMLQLRRETASALADGTMLDEVDINQALRDSNIPVLMLQGDVTTGGFLPDQDVEEMKTLFPDFESQFFAGMNHSLDYVDPGDAFAATSEFLGRRHEV